MVEPESLTLTFLNAHPGEAARVLERMPAADSAALFERLPARAGAPVLSAMLPPAAARTIAALEDKPALALLTSAGAQSSVAILRHVSEARRARLLEGLPTATAVASRLLLGYPEDSVGAWADPDIITLPPETRVGDALVRIRSGDESNVEQVHAVRPDQRLEGIVDLHALLRAPETAAISTLMHKPAAVFPAATPLTSAATQRGWQQANALPVVDRNERLIGALRRSALVRALARGRAPAQVSEEDILIGVLAAGYWDAVSGLVEAAVVLLPPATPVKPEKQ